LIVHSKEIGNFLNEINQRPLQIANGNFQNKINQETLQIANVRKKIKSTNTVIFTTNSLKILALAWGLEAPVEWSHEQSPSTGA
jgi:hypothetical protein